MAKVSASEREALERCIGRLRELRVVREDSKSLVNLPLPIIRDAIREMTSRLRTARVIPTTANADLLTLRELRSAVRSGSPPEDLLIRKEIIDWKRERSWLPNGFLGGACNRSDLSFTGLGASSGRATGPVQVVRSVSDFPLVEPGDVLVARSTNPAWTILFGRLAGVIVENGSRLSHAAIVAREYGIPAVVGLPGVGDVLSDGERVCVDGDAGTVKRMGEERDWS